jgi:hypothetical protein
MIAQNWGRNYSPFNKHIHNSVLVVIGESLDLWKKAIGLYSFLVFIIRDYS